MIKYRAMFSSISDEWGTPKDLFELLDKEFNFDLDVCANANNAKVMNYITKDQDALTQEWYKYGRNIWCNPPYGRKVGYWVKKAALEAFCNNCTVVMLLPARTDTKWFHQFCIRGSEIRFLEGRIRFTNKDGKQNGRAPFPSMIVIFRPIHQLLGVRGCGKGIWR